MILAHSIADAKPTSNYNTPEEIIASAPEPISFDGVYRNVFLHRHLLHRRSGILFVTGDYVGKDNAWDTGQPFERFATWEEIDAIMDVSDLVLGWHTWSHPDLTRLSDEDLIREITPPPHFPVNHFAYPYGRFDARVVDAVRSVGFDAAWIARPVSPDPSSPFLKPRHHI